MHSTCNTIIEHDGKHEDFVHTIFQALLSGSNEVFQISIQCKEDEWDIGENISADELTSKDKEKNHNIVQQR